MSFPFLYAKLYFFKLWEKSYYSSHLLQCLMIVLLNHTRLCLHHVTYKIQCYIRNLSALNKDLITPWPLTNWPLTTRFRDNSIKLLILHNNMVWVVLLCSPDKCSEHQVDGFFGRIDHCYMSYVMFIMTSIMSYRACGVVHNRLIQL